MKKNCRYMDMQFPGKSRQGKCRFTRARRNGAALRLDVFSGTKISAVRRFWVVAAPGPDLQTDTAGGVALGPAAEVRPLAVN